MTGPRRHLLLLLPALLLAAAPAVALDAASGRLTVNVFGSAGYGRTGGNTYGPGDEEGSYENTSLALAALGHVTDRLTVAGQIFVSPAGEAELDWAFAEWKLKDALRLRLGKAKQPFGNYAEVADVGTLRPFFTLPTSIYGPAEITAEGYTGVGLSGFFRLSDAWTVNYDLYGGQMELRSYPAFAQLVDPAAIPGALEEFETRDMIGGRLSFETPLPGLTARLSAYTGVDREEAAEAAAEETEIHHSAAAASLEYVGDALSARAEYALLRENPGHTCQAAYVELAWKFATGLQLAGRVEGDWTKLDDFAGSSPLLRHQEAALGLNYWFSPDLVVKASYHLVDGNRFAYEPGLTAAPASFDETTHLFVLGAQFSM